MTQVDSQLVKPKRQSPNLGTRRYSVDVLASALLQCKGIKSAVCANIGIDHKTLERYLNEYPELQDAFAMSREIFIDFAHSALVKKIEEGDTASIIFALKTLGKERGWVERREVHQENQTEILVKAMDYRQGLQALKPPDAEEGEFREVDMSGRPILPGSDDDEEEFGRNDE